MDQIVTVIAAKEATLLSNIQLDIKKQNEVGKILILANDEIIKASNKGYKNVSFYTDDNKCNKKEVIEYLKLLGYRVTLIDEGKSFESMGIEWD